MIDSNYVIDINDIDNDYNRYWFQLNPILDNPKYLREQHILIAVKSEAGDESYGKLLILSTTYSDFHS